MAGILAKVQYITNVPARNESSELLLCSRLEKLRLERVHSFNSSLFFQF